MFSMSNSLCHDGGVHKVSHEFVRYVRTKQTSSEGGYD